MAQKANDLDNLTLQSDYYQKWIIAAG
jgi:hypothetical protein